MGVGERPDEFIRAGLATLGVEADEVELAVIGAAHAMFWPAILALFELDTGGGGPEHDPDFSRAPAS
jgi:hypothetical protein